MPLMPPLSKELIDRLAAIVFPLPERLHAALVVADGLFPYEKGNVAVMFGFRPAPQETPYVHILHKNVEARVLIHPETEEKPYELFLRPYEDSTNPWSLPSTRYTTAEEALNAIT